MRTFLKEHSGYLLALTFVGAFLYAFNLHNGLFWDDADWILNNPSVHIMNWQNIRFIFSHDALAGIGQVSNYYRPFLFLTFLGNYLISGSSPASYHVISNGIHILNGLLIFALLCHWLKSKRAAFLGALLFVIQPLQTESVAYISGRGDPLSVFWMLCGLGLFVYFKGRGRRLSGYFAAVSCLALAILSRETAVLFPAYAGVALLAFEHQGTFFARLKKSIIEVLPFVGVSAIYGFLRLTVLNFQNTLNFYQNQNIYSEHISYRVFTFLHALLVYIRLSVWPVGLHMERDIPVNVSMRQGWAWLGALLIVAIVGGLIYAYRRRVPAFYIWLFGAAVFFINLGPTSGLVPINARIYEHWLYMSLFGLSVIAGWYLHRLLLWTEHKRPSLKPALVILLVGYCAFLSIQTIRRNILWGNTEAFYLNILHYEPHNVRVLNNLANWYSDQDKNSEAAALYQKAITTDPLQPAPYFNLGNIMAVQGDLTQAELLYKKSIEADSRFYYAYRNLANLYIAEHKTAQAIEILERLESFMPSSDIEAALEKLRVSP